MVNILSRLRSREELETKGEKYGGASREEENQKRKKKEIQKMTSPQGIQPVVKERKREKGKEKEER